MQKDDEDSGGGAYIGRMKEGVCYNLCFPLAGLPTTTRNQPYSMKTLLMRMTKTKITTMPGMTLKMSEIELMSAALGAAVFTLYTILSLSNLAAGLAAFL